MKLYNHKEENSYSIYLYDDCFIHYSGDCWVKIMTDFWNLIEDFNYENI